jgi:hypothetical protein
MGLLDRDNLVAIAWGVVYTLSLVLTVDAFGRLGIVPAITVPVVVVALPLAVGGLLFIIERALAGRADG